MMKLSAAVVRKLFSSLGAELLFSVGLIGKD
jgi:hypothetical protein